jgi:hypothetical protein
MDTTTYIFYTLTLSNRNVPALRVPGMDDRHHSGVEIRWRHGDHVNIPFLPSFKLERARVRVL